MISPPSHSFILCRWRRARSAQAGLQRDDVQDSVCLQLHPAHRPAGWVGGERCQCALKLCHSDQVSWVCCVVLVVFVVCNVFVVFCVIWFLGVVTEPQSIVSPSFVSENQLKSIFPFSQWRQRRRGGNGSEPTPLRGRKSRHFTHARRAKNLREAGRIARPECVWSPGGQTRYMSLLLVCVWILWVAVVE